MKPPQRTEAERIAGTLTKRSRRAVVLIGDDWTREGWGETLPDPNDLYSLYEGRNRNLGLIEAPRRVGVRQALREWKLTPLGRDVREVILSQEQTDER